MTDSMQDRRRLIALVHMDMVGYSRLMGLDDVGTLERLQALRRDLIDPAIEEHSGRLVNTGGDSLLIAFESVEGAVRYAVKAQEQVPIHDGDQPEDRAIRFRVGINIGDTIAEGTDLYGDAVNVAARLQAECPVGGICVSRSVRDHVHGRLGLEFEELGPLNLKNIARPVEAFLVEASRAPIERTLVHGSGDALPLPDKPSIAVLPFDNLSADPEQEFFSDGVADDIITELSRSRSLFVIARNSSFTYRGRAVDVRQVGRALGVRYVLEGSVRRSGTRVRVVAQLIEAETGNHIWAERYDRTLEEVFVVQDEITGAVTAAILPAVSDAEQRRALRKPPESLGAWEAYQRGLWHYGKANVADNERAEGYLERAISLDSTFAAPYSHLGLALFQAGGTYASRPLEEAARSAGEMARKAVENDPNDADALTVLAFATWVSGDREAAWDWIRAALASSTNSSLAHGMNGTFLVWSGCPSEGRDEILAALRLNPRDPRNTYLATQIAVSHYFQREYESSVEAAKRAIVQNPGYPQPYRWLAAALGQLNRTKEAYEALGQALNVSPSGFDFYMRSRPAWFLPEHYEHMLDGLRKAGWKG